MLRANFCNFGRLMKFQRILEVPAIKIFKFDRGFVVKVSNIIILWRTFICAVFQLMVTHPGLRYFFEPQLGMQKMYTKITIRLYEPSFSLKGQNISTKLK